MVVDDLKPLDACTHFRHLQSGAKGNADNSKEDNDNIECCDACQDLLDFTSVVHIFRLPFSAACSGVVRLSVRRPRYMYHDKRTVGLVGRYNCTPLSPPLPSPPHAAEGFVWEWRPIVRGRLARL